MEKDRNNLSSIGGEWFWSGAAMEPMWQLLNSKTTSDDWGEKHKAVLRSAAAGRQFTQSRVKLCGLGKP